MSTLLRLRLPAVGMPHTENSLSTKACEAGEQIQNPALLVPEESTLLTPLSGARI